MRLLSQKAIVQEYITFGYELIREYLQDFAEFYDTENMTYNLQIHLHFLLTIGILDHFKF